MGEEIKAKFFILSFVKNVGLTFACKKQMKKATDGPREELYILYATSFQFNQRQVWFNCFYSRSCDCNSFEVVVCIFAGDHTFFPFIQLYSLIE